MSDVSITELIAVAVPTVPFGPEGIPRNARDAKYYREAARNIRYQAARGNEFSGSNLTETVARLCVAVAEALERVTVPSENERQTLTKALFYTGSDGVRVFKYADPRLDLDSDPFLPELIPAIVAAGFRLPVPVEPEWEYGSGLNGPRGFRRTMGASAIDAGPWLPVEPLSGGQIV